MKVLEKVQKVLKMGPVCDACLGRQFAQLLSGYSNPARGAVMRQMLAFEKDAGEEFETDLSNFSGIKFRHVSHKNQERKKCWVCDDFFYSRLQEIVQKIDKISKGMEFGTFLIGTRPSAKMVENEEYLWENVGIEWVEPIKAEINRAIGSSLEKIWDRKADLKRPDVAFLVDLGSGKIEVSINPLYVYGEYQKLKRGIPQTKWPSKKYKTSVEQIMAKPFMKITKGTNHKLHGAGREDVDALCLAYRPFVLEIIEPKKRSLDLKRLAKEVARSKAVKIHNLKIVDSSVVEKVKSAKPDKSYEAICVTQRPLEKSDEKKIRKLVGEISQRTPERVLHRRGDLYRNRKIRSIKFKKINSKKFKLDIKAESGTYIKEFVSGDNGRTRPSVASAIGKACKVKDLTVTEIFLKEKLA